MHSDPTRQSKLVRCDLCGRETGPFNSYTIFSRVVPMPNKTISLTQSRSAPLTQETGFRARAYQVCGRCNNRKMVFLVVALAMLAGWTWLAIESDSPLFPLIGLVIIISYAMVSGRFLPVQRLVRPLRRELRAAVEAENPDLRFRVETLTDAAYRMRTSSNLPDRIIKRCGACKKEVPASSKVGDSCPHCSVRWGWEDNQKSA